MKYYKFFASTPYTENDGVDVYEFEDTVTEDELRVILNGFIVGNAEDYEYLAEDEIDRNDYVTEEDYLYDLDLIITYYYHNCDGHYEEITKEEYEEFRGIAQV